MKPIPLTAILAGGRGRRMGRDKALLPLAGIPMLERVLARVSVVSDRVVVVGGMPRLDGRGVETIADRYPGGDSMGAIATALGYAAESGGPGAWVLCVACDTPFLEPKLLAHLAGLREGVDVVVPRIEAGYEPLCALYGAQCLAAFEEQLQKGNLRIQDIYRRVRTRVIGEDDLRRLDPALRSFLNINRPADLNTALRELEPEGKRLGLRPSDARILRPESSSTRTGDR